MRDHRASILDMSVPKQEILDAARLLLEEWRFRHTHAWSVLARYYVSAVAVSIAPYVINSSLAPELRAGLRPFVFLFPLAGAILGLAAVWVYGAEYLRMQSPLKQYQAILQDHGLFKHTLWEGFDWLFKYRVGRATFYFLGLSTILLACANFAIIYRLWDQL
jgi:hypothetical protein